MAQQHLDPTNPTATTGPPVPATPNSHPDSDALASYLRAQATEFLRALRLHRESGGGAHANGAHGPDGAPPPERPVDAARALRRAARRLSGTLHTYQPLLDAEWAEAMRPELAWLSGTLALEHAYASRLERLLQALHRLSGSSAFPDRQPAGRAAATAAVTVPAAAHRPPPDRAHLTVGAAKAGALLDRQLTLARTRAHSTALQALGSSRFHAVADKVALLASEVPLRPTTGLAPPRPLPTTPAHPTP
ncbi:CHAD domain-containing protein, partial [Streptomyces sp. AC627_RSS907]|uniref:CHAD domain-containing protein n=1 Tax=Streptomyces sp. AC627_RSS907 TaxID=2823684 RepID=UPI001C2213A6